MLDTTLAALVSSFLIDPLQAEMSKRLETACAPAIEAARPFLASRQA